MESSEEILEGTLHGAALCKPSMKSLMEVEVLQESSMGSFMESSKESFMETLYGILCGILSGIIYGIPYGNALGTLYVNPSGNSLWKLLGKS